VLRTLVLLISVLLGAGSTGVTGPEQIAPRPLPTPPPEIEQHVQIKVRPAEPSQALASNAPVSYGKGCHPEPVTANTPSGIAGCIQWGEGKASYYTPTGNGVAMNYCTWVLRHTQGCGSVSITSLDTGVTVTAPVVDFCDCYWTTDRRLVDLQGGVVHALGLDPNRGIWRVRVEPA